jgi:hypothetical protein
MWSPNQEVHSARIERIQHNFIRFALLRGLGWTAQPLSPYESRCLLLGLEVLSDSEYCGLFGFRDDESQYVFRNSFSCALSGERFHLL